MGSSWVEWIWAVILAALGVAARLGHAWTQGKSGVAPAVTGRDVVTSLIAAPVLGIVAYGIGDFFHLGGPAIGAACGFAGLLGPAALISLWDRISNAALSSWERRDRK